MRGFAGFATARPPATAAPPTAFRNWRRCVVTIWRSLTSLCENFLNHAAVHVGQPAVGAVVADGEPFVVDAEQVQDGGVDVVTIDLALAGPPGPFVALAVGDARLN